MALFDLISDSTALVDLPSFFRSKEFFFVLSSDAVIGFVHFSDFNRSIMKVPFFILLEAVERHLWLQVSNKVNEESLSDALPDSRVKIITKRRERAQKKDVDLGWSGLFSFSEILQFSLHFDVVNINQDDLTLLASIRNRVAHADKLLVETSDDTDKLVKVHELCLEIVTKGGKDGFDRPMEKGSARN